MKKIFILFLMVLSNYSFSQTYTWVITDTALRSSYYSEAAANIAKDTFGNLYVAYAPYVDAAGADYIVIIKYNASHAVVWKQKISAICIGRVQIGLCTDIVGNIYITSSFCSYLKVDSTICASVGGGNMFLVKLNSLGVFQWVKYSTGSASGFSVSCDGQNNVFVAGYVNDDAYFDGKHISTRSFLVKYNSNGTFQWVKGITAYGPPKIKTDSFGNTYMAGNSPDYTIYFDSIPLSAYGFGDLYIAKIDSSGNWLWVKHAGGIYDDGFADLALDDQSNVYVTGYMESPTALFGSITLTNYASGADDYFVAKYDSNGNAIWASNPGGGDFGYDICADKHGNVYIQKSGCFMTKYDNAGNFLWCHPEDNANNGEMVADDSGSVYIVGTLRDAETFDSFTFTTNQRGMLIAQFYDPSPNTTSVPEVEYSSGFSVYPNPSNRIITININNNDLQGDFTLRVNNSLGKMVYSEGLKEITNSYAKQIDLSLLSKGIYFVELQPKSSSSSQKTNKKNITKLVLQ